MTGRVEGIGRDGLGIVEPAGQLPTGELLTLGRWGLRAGDTVLHASRDVLIAELEKTIGRLREYAMAEHENGYHLGQPEKSCPACASEEIRRCASR